MKNILLLLILTSILACKGNKTEALAEVEIEVVDKEFDFGQISFNDSIRTIFNIKNISDNPLIISKVGTSCGCTTSHFTKGEVNKNAFAQVEVVFKPNSLGFNRKSIVVEMNTDPPFKVFYIKGNVIE